MPTKVERRDGSVAVTVRGPISGGLGRPFGASILDLDAYGYRELEYFYEGEARAYALEGEPAVDGRWDLKESDRAPFASRLLVRRPVDPARFNGTVVLEWLNVTGGADGDPGFMYNHQEILREGYAWVGVSAQRTGVEGGGFALIGTARPLKQHDPARYGDLHHPGDGYSFDIYTRAGQIVGGAGEIDVLEGLVPKRLVAYGESQSAMRLVSYVNGVHPIAGVFDGFFIHSRGVGGASFANEPGFGLLATPARIRDDLSTPVFQFQTETDVLGSFGYLAARQPDTDRLRSWEVAGTAHADAYILGVSGGSNLLPLDEVNDGPQHLVIKAALHALHRWLADGIAPPTALRLMSDEKGEPIVDEHGNTRGGVRTPAVDVPIAMHSGKPAPGSKSPLAILFGHSVPFSDAKRSALYPSHEDYVAKVTDAARRAREGGFLLAPEEQAIVAEAKAPPPPRA